MRGIQVIKYVDLCSWMLLVWDHGEQIDCCFDSAFDANVDTVVSFDHEVRVVQVDWCMLILYCETRSNTSG